MKISLLPAIVGLTVAAGAPAYAACLTDVTKFQDGIEAEWQSANYQPTAGQKATEQKQSAEKTEPAEQQQAAKEDQATDKSLENRTSETGPKTTEDAKEAVEEEQAKADPEAVEEATETVKEELAENNTTIKEDGGTTTYVEGGPAQPTENWFGKPPRQGAVLAKLDEARGFAEAGDEAACDEALTAAQKLATSDE